MIKTSTSDLEITLPGSALIRDSQEEEPEPGEQIIRNILDFSKNLEVHESTQLGHLDFIKS